MDYITRRAFGLLTGGAAASASSRVFGATPVASAPAEFDPTPYVNPQLRPFVAPITKMVGRAQLTPETLAARRAANFALPVKPAPVWVERMISGPAGAPDVRIYVVNAGTPGAAPRPAILQVHGGGFVIGSAKQAIGPNQDLAAALDCVIISVDYRLAPETRFPGALDDNYAALKWLYRNANELGVDRARIAVMGESAGGGHAAMLAIAARDRGEIPLVYQALIYPMLDDRTGSINKKPPYIGAIIWNEQSNRFGWTSLLGVPAGSAKVPYGSVPARVENLKGLPPAFIGVGSIDLFVDEDVEYARRLIDSGVPVRLDVVPGAFHGFDAVGLMGDVPLAKAFRAELIASLREALKPQA